MQAKAPAERDVEALLCGFETTSNRSWPNESWIIHVNNPWLYYASVNSKHQHPPLGDPQGFTLYCCPGPGFILDDLPRGPGFCISIKLCSVQ